MPARVPRPLTPTSARPRGSEVDSGANSATRGVRRLVRESWTRSLQAAVDPDQQLDRLDVDERDLREYRDAHPLSLALPTIHRLLVRHSVDVGLIVAIGDQNGRLLWIDGDRSMRRKAEGMLFVEGADWSESAVGTSAPGTALALDRGIQIRGAEHFNRNVHPWSCTAVPVHDPDGVMLGVIDITGGAAAVAPATLPLLEAAVAAVEAELHVRRLDEARTPRRASHRIAPRPQIFPTLSVLGPASPRLTSANRSVDLTERHAEILALLAWHPEGLSADRLADLLGCTALTLRAEMVRVRRAVESVDASLLPQARPYRLPRRLELDAHRVLAYLDRGAHRVALAGYPGAVLPASTAPGIREIRDEVAGRLRSALLADASADTLLAFARTDAAVNDVEVWRECLRLLPSRSPKRAAVVERIERIDAEFSAP